MLRALITALALFAPAVAQATTYEHYMARTVIIPMGYAEYQIIDRWMDEGYRLEEFTAFGNFESARYGELIREYVTNAAVSTCLVRDAVIKKEDGEPLDPKTLYIPQIRSVSIHENKAIYLFDCGENMRDTVKKD